MKWFEHATPFLRMIGEELYYDFELLLQHRYLVGALTATVLGIFLFSNPPPPGHIVLAAGPPGSAYSAFGKHYREFFHQRGIELKVLETEGAVENARLIADPKSTVEISFVQAGLIPPETASGLRSMGSLNYEPIWLFFRGSDNEGKLQKFLDLGPRRIAIGAPQSGSYAAAMKLLALNKQKFSQNLIAMPINDAIKAIAHRDIDAILLVDGADAENVQHLSQNAELQLANFPRAAAYARAVSHWQALVVPMGGLDIARNFPPQDTHIVSTTTDMIIKPSLHPALQMLLLQAAEEVHGHEAFFERRGEFPTFKNTDVPESEEARIFYKSGPPILMRYLPFWLAEFVSRMSYYLLPLFLLSYPTIKILLSYRAQQGRIKINAIYRKLTELESEIVKKTADAEREGYLEKLSILERSAMALRLPRELSGENFMLRSNIDYVRKSLLRGELYVDKHTVRIARTDTSPASEPSACGDT
jgi:TRAP-type uncharacterized transport system substrate-binding protein